MQKKKVVCKDVFGNEYEHDIDDLTQIVSVYAVVTKSKKLLLTKQWDGYSLVGGGVEKGETLEDALKREVKEETGLDVEVGEIFYNTCTYFQKDKDSDPKQAFQFYFDVLSVSGEISKGVITDNEKDYTTGTAEWVELGNLRDIVFRHSVDLTVILENYEKRSH